MNYKQICKDMLDNIYDYRYALLDLIGQTLLDDEAEEEFNNFYEKVKNDHIRYAGMLEDTAIPWDEEQEE